MRYMYKVNDLWSICIVVKIFAQVAKKMSKFGMVHVKQYTPKRMLVAVANHGRLVIFVFY